MSTVDTGVARGPKDGDAEIDEPAAAISMGRRETGFYAGGTYAQTPLPPRRDGLYQRELLYLRF